MHWCVAFIWLLCFITVVMGLYGIMKCEREWRAQQDSSRDLRSEVSKRSESANP